jgi:hypothetical protein
MHPRRKNVLGIVIYEKVGDEITGARIQEPEYRIQNSGEKPSKKYLDVHPFSLFPHNS